MSYDHLITTVGAGLITVDTQGGCILVVDTITNRTLITLYPDQAEELARQLDDAVQAARWDLDPDENDEWVKGPVHIAYGAGLAGTPILQWLKDNMPPDTKFAPR